uniref:Secreted protein n=1 Tax=Ascaris lumbricoides TaxID=6252 RepID=A0A0M3HHR2_ASCLU
MLTSTIIHLRLLMVMSNQHQRRYCLRRQCLLTMHDHRRSIRRPPWHLVN